MVYYYIQTELIDVNQKFFLLLQSLKELAAKKNVSTSFRMTSDKSQFCHDRHWMLQLIDCLVQIRSSTVTVRLTHSRTVTILWYEIGVLYMGIMWPKWTAMLIFLTNTNKYRLELLRNQFLALEVQRLQNYGTSKFAVTGNRTRIARRPSLQ